ncbi:MAG TPA: rhomboid family intramembrane serine protease [Polyangiales bacterium]|nr:rhomboid family intramembrane serine protease [Polyangiales bacterium]
MFQFPPLTPFVKKLLITLFAIFVFAALATNFMGVPIVRLFALDTSQLSVATLWQIFTNVLVQSPTGVFPLIINLVFIWLILPPFEDRYAAARTVQLLLAATVCSSLAALVTGLLIPSFAVALEGPGPLTLGAMSAYAVLLPPNAQVNFFGVLPMRSQHLLWVIVGLSVLGFITSKNLASLASDLGAIGGGIGFVKLWMQRPPRKRTFQKKATGKLRVVSRDDDKPRGGWMN